MTKTTQENDEPPMAFAAFVASTGNSPVTGWRWEKKGMVKTINICGRKYIAREEVRRFNARAAAGEFAKDTTVLSNRRASKSRRG